MLFEDLSSSLILGNREWKRRNGRDSHISGYIYLPGCHIDSAHNLSGEEGTAVALLPASPNPELDVSAGLLT